MFFKRKNKEENKNKFVVKHYGILSKAEIVAQEVLSLVDSFAGKEIDFISETNKLKSELNSGKTLDDIIVRAFALAYKAVKEVYNISLYKVQIMGAFVLNKGDVAEMKTGEGKTLTAILPAYLNALAGLPVHIITVNEYLAQRDSINCGKVFSKLGVSTGVILRDQDNNEKRSQYLKDIVYTTNSEIGFDYLRDNMAHNNKSKIQRGFSYAIIDEVDSILIDEARTPLIIAGGSSYSEDMYRAANDFVITLTSQDYEVDKETNTAFLNNDGIKKAERYFNTINLYNFDNSLLVHRIHNALHANFILTKDIEYTVKDNEIVLIDIFTGRLLPGRSFSEGLNQAIEAKENVPIKPETKVIATITYQNLFRMYKKLSGMTGTAFTEEEEFIKVYNMRVVPIPTNKGINRIDHTDLIFATKKAKFKKAILKIEELYKKGQPVLVGTRSVQDSEMLSELLMQHNLPHNVLNAKNNAYEADIIAGAGQQKAITISTNMAGRGTDIKLGQGVIELGGLFVLGLERHEARRIDNQLRGRSGRQGDIGHSQFFVSLEDEVLVRAGLKKIARFAKSLDENPIESKTLTRAITSSQKKIEGLNYDSRKSIIEYDDVSNRQRLLTYKQRDAILTSENVLNLFKKMLDIYINSLLKQNEVYENGVFKTDKFIDYVNSKFELENPLSQKEQMPETKTIEYVLLKLENILNKKFEEIELEDANEIIRRKLLMVLDYNWQDQIDKLVKLKSSIHYRQYAQKNPIQIFLHEADALFRLFKEKVIEQSVFVIFRTSNETVRHENASNEHMPSSKKERQIKDFTL